MKVTNEYKKILAARNQLHLFGHEYFFNFFIQLYEKKELPNSMLLSGPKGSGKSTFAYHITNYLLSKNEERKYSIKDFTIDENNLSYKLLNTNIHPNFFLIENNILEKDIKIDQIRNLLKFLNKTTYNKNIKIVMIDNAENLNLNASNALLNVIEEPKNNTFFFIIYNNSSKILDTIKSRCTEFKFNLTKSKKKEIFTNVIKQYKNEFKIDEIIENYYFDTPGNLVKYFLALDDANMNITGNTLKCIFHFIEMYKNEKNPETLSLISLFVEKYYNELCLNNKKRLSIYFFNRLKILRQIDEMKRFNLEEKNIFIWIKDILQNEAK